MRTTTEETKAKMRDAMKARWLDPAYRATMLEKLRVNGEQRREDNAESRIQHLPCSCGEIRCTDPTHSYPQRDTDGKLCTPVVDLEKAA